VPPLGRIAASLAVALITAGCGAISTSPPAPTPADFGGIAAELGKGGVLVSDVVSGDAGCPDRELVPTAIRVDAHGLDQTTPVRIYLYIFRNRSSVR